MLKQISIIFFLLSLVIFNISGKTVFNKPKRSSESGEDFSIPDALKKFVEFVEKHDLNVSVIASENRKGPSANTKQELAITLHMPKNNKQLTAPTLDDAEQARYLKEMKTLEGKEKVGAKVRTIPILNGHSIGNAHLESKPEHMYNPQYAIDTMNYELLTRYENGKRELAVPEGETYEMLYNYIVKEGDEKNIQVLTGNVVIVDQDAGPDTPLDKYTAELEKNLPLIWMSVDDDTLMAKLLAEKLDQAFPDKNHQVLIGVGDFYSSSKHWVKFMVAQSDIVIFNLPI